MIEALIKDRGIEAIPSTTAEEWATIREQYKRIFTQEVYGTPLPEPEELTFETVSAGAIGRNFCAGKVQSSRSMRSRCCQSNSVTLPVLRKASCIGVCSTISAPSAGRISLVMPIPPIEFDMI